MKIYINKNYEIKAINFNGDETLKEIEVDRENVFGNKSDYMILNYCYKQDENGYSIYPASDYLKLLQEDNKIKLEESQKKILVLKEENENMLLNILSIIEAYEINNRSSVPINDLNSKEEDKKVTTYIQAIYKKLYELKIKTIEEIPFEIRENINI